MLKMKKAIFILTFALFGQSLYSQKYLKATNSFGSIQIKFCSEETSKLYYVIYKVLPTVDPTPSELKTLSSNAVLTNIERKGTITHSTATLGDTLIQSLINIPNVTNATPKILYLYTVYENASGTLGAVNKQNLTFTRKQPAYTFQSTTLEVGKLTTVNYLTYLPESYYHDEKRTNFPTIMFFHGDWQKGDNIDQVRTDALPNYVDGAFNTEFIVVSPQQNGWKQTWTKPSFVEELITLTRSNYRVDTNKIYGVGCSGGGGGLYFYTSAYPERFAGMSPMSGVNIFTSAAAACVIKDIPFWGFHSTADNTVTYNNLNVVMTDVTKCGPIIPMKKTAYVGNIHDCWKYPLKQDSIYRFFLARDLSNKSNAVEPIDFDTNLTVTKGSNPKVVIDFPTLVNDPSFEYFWYQKSGSDVVLAKPNSRTPYLVNPAINGTYKFRLLLKRPKGNMNYRDVVVKVVALTTALDAENEKEEELKDWTAHDMQGRLAKQGKASPVDLSGLVPGVYIIHQGKKKYKVFTEGK
jgi:hypothetical protein